MRRTLVFVYGTLKRGQPNHHRLTSDIGVAAFLGDGVTVTRFPLVVASKYHCPFLLAKHGYGNRILGEVYEVDDKKLADLDELEAYPDLYDREKQDIEMSDGQILQAYTYMLRSWDKSLLELPLLTSYKDGIDGKFYVTRSEPNNWQHQKISATEPYLGYVANYALESLFL